MAVVLLFQIVENSYLQTLTPPIGGRDKKVRLKETTFSLQCHRKNEVHRDYAGSLIANYSWSMNCLIANESWFGLGTLLSKTLRHVSFHKFQAVYVIIWTLSIVACPSGSPTCYSTNVLLKLHHYVAKVELIGAIYLVYERVFSCPPKLIWHRSSLTSSGSQFQASYGIVDRLGLLGHLVW